MINSSASPLRVLIIDDEKNISETLTQIFRLAGFDAHCAHTGETAIRMLPQHRPQLLIADVILGGMDGIQLALIAAELLPDCSIVLFSGHASQADLSGRLSHSGRSLQLLTKPVAPRVFLDLARAESERRGCTIPPRKLASGETPVIRPVATQA